jgi:hypothetical protein
MGKASRRIDAGRHSRDLLLARQVVTFLSNGINSQDVTRLDN